ncbi:MAG: phosphatidylglycerophosphatase A [Brevinematales bacterium]|nr:phosphatidylglycerophosphatase A [Brevinematales bacterium]
MKKFFDLALRFLATGGAFEYLPSWARGTFGTLIGVLVFVLLSNYEIIFYGLLVLLMVLAFPVSNYAENKILKGQKTEYVVIDEIVGYMISTIGFKFSFSLEGFTVLLLTFVIFRIFDTFKPYPITHIRSFGNGVGIVLDDIFAGVVTNILVRILLAFEVSRIFIPLLM